MKKFTIVIITFTWFVGLALWRGGWEVAGFSARPKTLASASGTHEKPVTTAQASASGMAAAEVFATFTVTTTNDSGAGSLRQAITNANANAGPDTIVFNIGTGTPTINVLSALPTISSPVTISGNTGGATRVELNGASAGSGVYGLTITAGSSTIEGLVINRFSGRGIFIQTNGGNTVRNCYIGTNASGTAVLGNGEAGVLIDAPNNTIGGTTAGERNVICGNQFGVRLQNATTTGNKISGNYIGTNANGTAALGNAFHGVYIGGSPNNTIGGTAAGERNVIAGNNGSGVVIEGAMATGNKVSGNYLGTDANGTARLGNTLNGVQIIAAPNNTIGGPTASERNVISGNEMNGVLITGATTTGNKVSGNYIGTNMNGTAALGNSFDGVILGGAPNNTIGGTAAGERNVISGNNLSGVVIRGGTAAGNKVSGNYLGTNVNGTASLGNGKDGVYIDGAPNSTVGGTTAGERNVISGNNEDGVSIVGTTATSNKVSGNFIGTDLNGTARLRNSFDGVTIESAPNNMIGGTTAGEPNVISGNDRYGVLIIGATATGNKVSGNAIFNNASLGIGLNEDGVTPNDTRDPDTGPNNLQNFPVLANAVSAGNETLIEYSLNSLATTAFRIEFFVNDTCDASGNGEGQTFLGFLNVTTDGNGNVPLNDISAPINIAGKFLTATATRLDASNNPVETSEFSACRAVANVTVSVSAASFSPTAFASEAITAAFGVKLATRVQASTTTPLPTTLAGTTLKVKDSLGVERLAPLFFVSPDQINYLIPTGTAPGEAIVTVTSGDGSLSLGALEISSVAPGLFTANANGQGVPAAVLLRVSGNGTQSLEVISRFDGSGFVPLPLDLGPASDQVFLILFGTGFRFNMGLSAVTCSIGGANAEVTFASAQGGLVGLDQANVRIPRSLIGRGLVNVILTVNGKAANTVQLNIK